LRGRGSGGDAAGLQVVNAQAAAIATMVPVTLSIGFPPGNVVAFTAAC